MCLAPKAQRCIAAWGDALGWHETAPLALNRYQSRCDIWAAQRAAPTRWRATLVGGRILKALTHCVSLFKLALIYGRTFRNINHWPAGGRSRETLDAGPGPRWLYCHDPSWHCRCICCRLFGSGNRLVPTRPTGGIHRIGYRRDAVVAALPTHF